MDIRQVMNPMSLASTSNHFFFSDSEVSCFGKQFLADLSHHSLTTSLHSFMKVYWMFKLFEFIHSRLHRSHRSLRIQSRIQSCSLRIQSHSLVHIHPHIHLHIHLRSHSHRTLRIHLRIQSKGIGHLPLPQARPLALPTSPC